MNSGCFGQAFRVAMNYAETLVTCDKIRKLIDILENRNDYIMHEIPRLAYCTGTKENPHDHNEEIASLQEELNQNRGWIDQLKSLKNDILAFKSSIEQVDQELADMMNNVDNMYFEQLVRDSYSDMIWDDGWKDVLSKNADKISDEEYFALAQVFLNLDEEDMSDFSQILYSKKNEAQNSGSTNGGYWCDYSNWAVDKEKCNILNTCMETLLSIQYIDMCNTYKKYSEDKDIKPIEQQHLDAMKKERCDLLQKATIMQTLNSLDEIYNSYGSKAPIFSLNKGDNNSYIIQYGELESSRYPRGVATDFVEQKNILISPVYQGDCQFRKANNDQEIAFALKYNFAVGDIIANKCIDYGTDKAISIGIEKVGNELGSKSIPVIGELVGFGIDIYDEIKQAKEDREFAINTCKNDDMQCLFDEYELSSVYVEFPHYNNRRYTTYPNREDIVFCQPSIDTMDIIDRFNESELATNKAGGPITLEDVMFNQEELNLVVKEIANTNTYEYQDIFE